MKRQRRSFIDRILISGLLLICGAGTGDSGPIASAGARETQSREALARQLEQYYVPPAEFAGKFGSYRSPRKFVDGTPAKSAEDWARRRQEILATWHRRLGAWPALLERPEVTRLETTERDGFIQHHVHVQVSSDGKLADGYLLIPQGAGPFPAVFVPFYEPLTSIGQNDKGRGTHDYGLQLAKRGFVTLSIGTPGSFEKIGGDTRELLTDAGKERGRQPLTLLAYVAANCHTALAHLPQVDAARIGIIGLSYGGKWSMFASCLYDKFACAVWSDPGIVFDERNANVNYWEPWYLGYDPGTQRKEGIPSAENPRTGLYKELVEAGEDLVDLHALMAPRPVLVSGGTEDPPRNWQALNHLVAVNDLLGHKHRVALTARQGHIPTPAALELELAFLEYWLKEGAEPATAEVPVFEGLGSHGRKVTTSSAEAQKYFNQGLCFLFAFNHDEAIRSFRRAATSDPQCAMAWWGIAIANGPHINNPIVSKESARAAWDALTKARAAAGAGPIEKELIAALGKRYADPQPDDRKPLDEAYAAAMRDVWKAHPDDADVGALFAESLMDLRPWDLWTADEKAQPGTDEVVATLEAVLAKTPNHPLALHLYIHAVEASSKPERAVAPADRLRNLQPGLGHLVHMPSHIDVRTGRWAQAIEANAKAIEADRKYRAKSPRQGFYNVYMAHNHHMLAYAAIMRGQSQKAIAAINEMAQGIPPEFVKENAPLADGFTALPLEILVRFGRWDEVLAAPEPPDYLPIARTLRRCARSIAYAAKKDVTNARAERDEFLKARAVVPAEAKSGLNKAEDLLAVAEHLLAGEILYREGKVAEGIAELREAVRREDLLHYSEPPDWIHPVRHALGATLLAEGRAAEAEKVYRDDLKKLPDNGWSLFGLARSLRLQNKEDEAKQVEARFQKAWTDADIKISSSCFCQPGR
jgi:tetratricopeptide (TPR) repeat protein